MKLVIENRVEIRSVCSRTSFGSNQTLRFPQLSTEDASRFCNLSETIRFEDYWFVSSGPNFQFLSGISSWSLYGCDQKSCEDCSCGTKTLSLLKAKEKAFIKNKNPKWIISLQGSNNTACANHTKAGAKALYTIASSLHWQDIIIFWIWLTSIILLSKLDWTVQSLSERNKRISFICLTNSWKTHLQVFRNPARGRVSLSRTSGKMLSFEKC